MTNQLPAQANILIAVSDEHSFQAMELVLKSPRYRLVRAQTGDEAAELTLGDEFALILLDLQISGMTGLETAALIKSRVRTQNVPIIFMTEVREGGRLIAHGFDAGAVDYLFKPIDPHVLTCKVAAFVDFYFSSVQLEQHARLVRESEMQKRFQLLTELKLESLRRYHNLANAIPQIVWQASPTGEMEYFNNFWSAYSGLPADQSYGSGWRRAFWSEDLEGLLAAWSLAMETRSSFEAKCRILGGPDQLPLWHLIRGVPEFSDRGEFIGWVGTATHIHAMMETERLLLEAKEAADSANQEKSQFLANVSHEIRTPLGIMMGFADFLADQRISAQEREDYLTKVRETGKLLTRIVDDILDISRAEVGKLEIVTKRFSLQKFLRDRLCEMRMLATQQNLLMEVTLKTAIPEYIKSDEIRLAQILNNLLGNAVKFTQEGSITLLVEHRKSEEPPYETLTFYVRDCGPGITQHQAARLFQPFSQLERTRKERTGTGLGLALSRTLAHALGGDLALSDVQPQRGSEFRLTIPVMLPPDAHFVDSLEATDDIKPEISAVSTYSDSAPRPLDGVRVLLVEDVLDNQIIIQRLLSIEGATADNANNGVEGVKMALAGNYDVVLMDIQMPQLDGYAATKQLRDQGFHKPIIALTAHATRDAEEKCILAGCNAWLTKPIDREALVRYILKELDMSPWKNLMQEDLRAMETRLGALGEQLGADSVQAVLHAFLEGTQTRKRELEAAMKSENFEQVRSLLHSLFGSLSNVGAMHLARHCQELENQSEKISSVENVLKGVDLIHATYGSGKRNQEIA